MKKTLVALAALAATSAFAQSSVSIYGNLDQALYRGTDNGNAFSDIASNAGTTSTLGFRGKEDLGGGLAANFNLLSELSMKEGQMGSSTSGNAAASGGQKPNIFTRGATVGISSSTYGSLDVGRVTDTAWTSQGTLNNTGLNSFGWNAFTATTTNPGSNGITTFTGKTQADTAFSGTTTAVAASAAGAANTSTLGTANTAQTGSAPLNFGGGFSYTSPNINGLVGSIQSFGSTNTYNKTKSGNGMSYSLNYTTGPLRLVYGNTYRNDSTGVKGIIMDVYGAEYKMGAYTFVGGVTHTKYEGNMAASQDKVTVTGLGVGYALSPQIDLKAGYTTMKDNGAGMEGYQSKVTALTAFYKFSARTSTYAGYGKLTNEGANNKQSIWYGGSGPSAGAAAVTGTMVGIRHQF